MRTRAASCRWGTIRPSLTAGSAGLTLDAADFSGTISGTGGLSQATDTSILAGANAHGGDTNVPAGTFGT